MVLSLSRISNEKGLGEAEPDKTTAIWLALNQKHKPLLLPGSEVLLSGEKKKNHQTIPEYSTNKKVHIITNMARK